MKCCAATSVKIGLLQLLLAFQVNEACLDLVVRFMNQILVPVIETCDNQTQEPHCAGGPTKFNKRDKTGNFVLRGDKWLPANPFMKNIKFRRRGSKIKDRYKPVGRSLFGHLNAEARSNPDEESATEFQWLYNDDRDDLQTTRPPVENASSAANQTNASMLGENVNQTVFAKSMSSGEDDEKRLDAARKVQFASEYGDDDPDMEDGGLHAYEHKPKFYPPPGDRPIVDSFIKILEMFQEVIAANSKDKIIEN